MTAGLHSDLCSLYTSGVFLYESRCFSSLERSKFIQVYSGFHVHGPIINIQCVRLVGIVLLSSSSQQLRAAA